MELEQQKWYNHYTHQDQNMKQLARAQDISDKHSAASKLKIFWMILHNPHYPYTAENLQQDGFTGKLGVRRGLNGNGECGSNDGELEIAITLILSHFFVSFVRMFLSKTVAFVNGSVKPHP
ncbi:UDP-Glycosyltransferase superfamily protein [Striga asiatica]|uniref:UDP-Glycosyltransferase superfamily protein n=1 Tax=Striga asiatica TaxID=4170 RepID=A0A5A7QA03_STRAF|nr:UDP-Glycosyltransferase superfamily protein [Striga asiatica]